MGWGETPPKKKGRYRAERGERLRRSTGRGVIECQGRVGYRRVEERVVGGIGGRVPKGGKIEQSEKVLVIRGPAHKK